MSAIPEWSVPFTLTTPQGTLDLSAETGYRFIPEDCQAGVDVVLRKQQISGADGEIFSRRFKTGYRAQIAIQMLDDGGDIALGSTLVSRWNDLLLHLDALFNPTLEQLVSSCRLQWTPSGSDDDWMLNRIRLLERPTPTGVLPKIARFAVDTELPYAMRTTETTTSIAAGVTTTLDNSAGTTNFYPVIKVYGATASFTIVNAAALDANGNALQISYLGAGLPGGASIAGGHYVEIDCFRETVVLDGDVDFGSIAGIDIPNSELRLPIVPGDNPLTITGADMDILWQPARA